MEKIDSHSSACTLASHIGLQCGKGGLWNIITVFSQYCNAVQPVKGQYGYV